MIERVRHVLRVYCKAIAGFCAIAAILGGAEMVARADDLASGAFKREVLSLIKRERPKLAAMDTGKLDAINVGDLELGLVNLFRSVRDISGQEREAVILTFVDRAVVPSEPEYPTIASAAPKLRAQIIPYEFVEQRTGELKLVSRPLSAYVAIGYALDEPDRISYLNQGQLSRWKADVAEVNVLAVANLEGMSVDVPVEAQGTEGEGRFWVQFFDDGYGSARILCPEFVKRLKTALGETFFVGIPNRDILIAWSPDWNQRVEFAEQIRRDFGSEPHPRSPEIFAIDSKGLRLATAAELRDHGR